MSPFWLASTLAAVIGLAVREVLIAFGGKIGPWLIKRAADRLPGRRRAVRQREWLAEFDYLLQRGLVLTPVTFSLGTVISTVGVRNKASDTGESPARQSAAQWIVTRCLRRFVGFWRRHPALTVSFSYSAAAYMLFICVTDEKAFRHLDEILFLPGATLYFLNGSYALYSLIRRSRRSRAVLQQSELG
jgi:hypothetical protein